MVDSRGNPHSYRIRVGYMITDATKRKVCERDGVLKPEGFDPHHAFFKSEYYKEDRDDEWNICAIKRSMHDGIHHQKERKYRLLEIRLKEEALVRYDGKYREELSRILKQKKKHYGVG